MDLNDKINLLHKSAELVKAWGKENLANGKTLNETMTIKGLSLWEAIAPIVAIYHLPGALSSGSQVPTIRKKMRPYLSWAKNTVFNRITVRGNIEECEKWVGGKTFLFLGFSDYIYRETIHPVVSHFTDDKSINTVSLHDGHSKPNDWLTETQHGFESIWRHWDKEVQTESAKLFRDFFRMRKELNTLAVFSKIMRDEEHLLWTHMQYSIKWFFWSYIPRLLPQIAVAHHILARHRPALIVSSDVADPRTRIYCILCRKLGVPSLEIQFGFYDKLAVEWQFFIADHLAIWGEKTRETMLMHEVPDHRMTITGSPRHDGLMKKEFKERNKLRAALKIPDGKTIVLFASMPTVAGLDAQVSPEQLSSVKEAIFQAASRVPEIWLVVKPHPIEKPQEIKKIAKKYTNVVIVDKHANIVDMIKDSAAFIALGSTSTFDALIMNVLTICPALPGWDLNRVFADSKAVLVPRTIREIEDCLKVVISGSCERILSELEPFRQHFLEKWAYKLDGLASARIATLAMQMTKNNIGTCS